MTSLESQLSLRATQAARAEVFRPQYFDLSLAEDRARLERLLHDDPALVVCDTLEQQLTDLVKAETFRKDLPVERVREFAREVLNNCDPARYGVWVHYPWARRLVHVLPEPEFHRLRTDRNRYKITPDEQRKLRDKVIGIVGLSVGRAAASTCVMEGVGGKFRIADFDALDLSNLNRLAAPVSDLGINKAVLAARHMVEIDPYVSVDVHPDGVSDATLDSFLAGPPKLDLVVEECDDLYMKIRVRERAREFGIPVVMDTSDRGLVDVERFDLEPSRPILHGLLADVTADQLKGLSNKDKVPVVLRILDAERLSSEFSATLVEIEESVYAWPQLASGVSLGGALVADVARRILIDRFRESGRYYVDIEHLIRDGAALSIPKVSPWTPIVAPEAATARHEISRPPPGTSSVPNLAEIQFVVAHAALAPSGGNTQPWQFEFDGRLLTCSVHPQRGATFLDFERRASVLAIGAAFENACIAASAIGFNCEVRPFPEGIRGPLVAQLACTRRTALERDPRFPWLTRRVTNRRYSSGEPLDSTQAARLIHSASAAGAHLTLISDREQLTAIGAVLGEADRIRFLSERMHAELVGELRWTAEQVRADRTGIDLTSLELEASDAAGMQVLAQWRNMAFLRRIGAGTALGALSRKALAQTAAFAVLSYPGPGGPAGYFEGGRALQRVWLDATSLGLALHPWTSLLYLAARRAADGGGLSVDEAEVIGRLDAQLRAIAQVPAGHLPMMAFRLSHAAPPTSRSLRLSLEEILSVRA